jgi:hypothetical protein
LRNSSNLKNLMSKDNINFLYVSIFFIFSSHLLKRNSLIIAVYLLKRYNYVTIHITQINIKLDMRNVWRGGKNLEFYGVIMCVSSWNLGWVSFNLELYWLGAWCDENNLVVIRFLCISYLSVIFSLYWKVLLWFILSLSFYLDTY